MAKGGAPRASGVAATLIELDDVHLLRKPENWRRRWIEEAVKFLRRRLKTGP